MEQQTPEQLQQQLTDRLTAIMQAKGISPTQLANSLGLNPSNVTGYMKGRKNPTLLTMQRIANVLGVPVWMLVASTAEVIADLRAAFLMPPDSGMGSGQLPAHAARTPAAVPASPGIAAADPAAQPAPSQQAELSPQDARRFDLCTIDPVTGETRLYRLV